MILNKPFASFSTPDVSLPHVRCEAFDLASCSGDEGFGVTKVRLGIRPPKPNIDPVTRVCTDAISTKLVGQFFNRNVCGLDDCRSCSHKGHRWDVRQEKSLVPGEVPHVNGLSVLVRAQVVGLPPRSKLPPSPREISISLAKQGQKNHGRTTRLGSLKLPSLRHRLSMKVVRGTDCRERTYRRDPIRKRTYVHRDVLIACPGKSISGAPPFHHVAGTMDLLRSSR